MSRRAVLSGLGAGVGVAALGAPAVVGQAKPKVVVVGGGAGGGTAARYIAKDSGGQLDVTLVEANRRYVTCFHSNLYIGGYKSLEELGHSYDAMARANTITMAFDMASQIDRDRKLVRLAGGQSLPYDRLVLSPGIDLRYDSVPGWGQQHEERMPHAWKPGAQTAILRRQLDAVPNGGVIVMIAPPNPFRCPPGPYERISMFAAQLKKTGRTNCKIVIIDPKETFSKQALFTEGWEKHYPGMIEWLGPKIHEGVKNVDPATMTVETGFETYRNAALVNVVPAQWAGKIARDAGLTNASGYCPIDPASMRSAVDANIYIVGDACIAGDMPKSAFAANSQAKIAAMMVRSELTGSRAFPARYTNTCWSLIWDDDAVKVGGQFEPRPDKITSTAPFISQVRETPELRKQTQAENMGWYAGIIADIFT
jgi:NADPH-dependent 2,4-dienoyl-CoA reductase/sulfur reductase-like enzyme